ncbi:MAG: response regulator, partial [Elusimicrobia bacterium]|nr:response regulator [Elusimicrobiota bacterium]
MARILIVEDDPDIAVNLAHLLISKGYEVTHAADGADALSHARKEVPDLILLDVMLPRMSGHDVCKILRAEPRTAKI